MNNELHAENESNPEINDTEQLIKAKENIYQLYNIMYSKINSYEQLTNEILTNKIDEKINDPTLTAIYFADWLINNQIGLISEADLKNRTTKRQYLRKFKLFSNNFVKLINDITNQWYLKNNTTTL